MADRWLEGIWLGTQFETLEHIIAMKNGQIIRARSVQAFPEEKLWCKELAFGVSAMPWDNRATLARLSQGRPLEPMEMPTPAEAPVDGTDPVAGASRGMPIRLPMLEKFGFTAGCRKCRLLERGSILQPNLGHNEECRRRIIQL